MFMQSIGSGIDARQNVQPQPGSDRIIAIVFSAHLV